MRSILFFLAFATAPLSAFDAGAFGERLNGWHRDGSAHYSLDGARYRTTKPVITADAEGQSVVRVTVIHLANSWAEVPFDLEVAFGPDGAAQAARISGSPRGQKVDTGMISKPSAPDTTAPTEAAKPPFHPLAEMEKMLFDSFHTQVSRAAEAEDSRKRDLLARIYGPEPIDPEALAKGLRYNLGLILRSPGTPAK